MLFKGIFWGSIISLPLWVVIYFISCQVVVNKGISYEEWREKHGITSTVEDTKYLFESYGVKIGGNNE